MLARALTLASLAGLVLAAPAWAGIGATVTPGSAGTYTVKVTATTDISQPMYALVRVADTPCAASFGADHGVKLASGVPVSGTVSISHEITAGGGGSYIVCSWLGTGAPVSTAFSTPPPATGPPSVALVEDCVVPRPPRTLAAAKARLRAAGCGVGTITRVRSHKYASGRVIRYSSPPGRTLASGTRVGIVVSRGV